MQTRDHALLGRFLLELKGARLDPVCRKLFLLGCIEPDWNPVTYVRGSLKYQMLHGHNAENARAHLMRLTAKLRKSGVRTPLQWFRFGAALHYLADSFTFAHNQIFTGGLMEHHLYEKLLHPVFTIYLQAGRRESFPADKACHQRYLAEQRSYQTDCRYILGTALDLWNQLSVQRSAVGFAAQPKAQGFYGKV